MVNSSMIPLKIEKELIGRTVNITSSATLYFLELQLLASLLLSQVTDGLFFPKEPNAVSAAQVFTAAASLPLIGFATLTIKVSPQSMEWVMTNGIKKVNYSRCRLLYWELCLLDRWWKTTGKTFGWRRKPNHWLWLINIWEKSFRR